jgi:hypothetical protein
MKTINIIICIGALLILVYLIKGKHNSLGGFGSSPASCGICLQSCSEKYNNCLSRGGNKNVCDSGLANCKSMCFFDECSATKKHASRDLINSDPVCQLAAQQAEQICSQEGYSPSQCVQVYRNTYQQCLTPHDTCLQNCLNKKNNCMNNGGNPGTCDPQWLNCQNNC